MDLKKKKSKKTNKKDSLVPPTWFSLLGSEKPACSLEQDEDEMCCSLLCGVIDCVFVPSGANFHLVLVKAAVCCGEPVTVFIPEGGTFHVHVQYLLSSDFDLRR